MQMNPDCVRDILKTLEEYASTTSIVEFNENLIGDFPLLKKYSLEEVLYHLKKCNEAGFLIKYSPYFASATVEDLHYYGHQFLANIHDDKIWAGVKGIAAKIGAKSLEALIQISSNVITELIKAQFGLA